MPDGSLLPSTQTTPRTALGDLSLKQVLAMIEADEALPVSKKTEWRCALRRLAKYLDKDLQHLPARLGALRYGMGQLHHARLGISKKSLQNLKASTKAILRYAGSIEGPNLRQVPLAPEWQDLFDRLETPRLRRGLSQLMRYCSFQGISPVVVTNRVIQDYIEALVEGSFIKKPSDRHRNLCKIWNEAAAQVPLWPSIKLEVPDFRRARRSLPDEAFPECFQADVEAYLAWLGGNDLLADDAPMRPCRERTCQVRRRYIYLAASAAVEGGVAVGRLTSLRDLVRPDIARVVLETYLKRTDDKVTTFISDLAGCLTSIARRWCKVPESELAELERLQGKLNQDRRTGLTDKNLHAIRLLKDPVNWARLRRLPQKLMSEALNAETATYRAAVKAQIAVAIQILIVAPMRIGNLAALSLSENVLQPGGFDGLVHLFIPDHKVKNGVPLEYPMPEEASALLLLYKRELRNRLKGANYDWLIPGENGHHKDERTLSDQITKTIERELGIHITPHQFRHAAAALILEANPGNYELVRRVLGHKNIQTTINFYVGLETAAAAKQYAELALRGVYSNEQKDSW